MAWCAAASAAWWRRALACARDGELSARFIAGTVVLEGFEGGDDLVQVGLDAAQVLGEAELPVALGLFDETAVGRGLPPVDLQELWRGLEVCAGGRLLAGAGRRWICRNSGVVWKSGQVRQAFGCGQSCCAGRPQ